MPQRTAFLRVTHRSHTHLVLPHWQGSSMIIEHGGQGPGWQRQLQGWVQEPPRMCPQSLPQLCAMGLCTYSSIISLLFLFTMPCPQKHPDRMVLTCCSPRHTGHFVTTESTPWLCRYPRNSTVKPASHAHSTGRAPASGASPSSPCPGT